MDTLDDLSVLFPVVNGKVSTAFNRLIIRNFKKMEFQLRQNNGLY